VARAVVVVIEGQGGRREIHRVTSTNGAAVAFLMDRVRARLHSCSHSALDNLGCPAFTVCVHTEGSSCDHDEVHHGNAG
jgi:hypothetical protein